MNYPKQRYTGEKPWMNREWLYNEYIVKDRRSADIAEEYGCKQNTIQCWLLKHNIKKKIEKHYHKPTKQYEMRDYLYKAHIVDKKSISQIARENNVSHDTIRANLIKNNIDYWRVVPQSSYSDEEVDRMVDMYCNQKMSANKISQLFQTDHNTIIRQLRSRGIDTRNMVEAQYAANGKDIPEDLTNAEYLKALHWDDGLSCKDIGAMYGVDAGSVRRQMHRLGIDTKSSSESKVGLMTGAKHPNWKGGVTPLYALLREYFGVNQAPRITARDNYTCQMCGREHCVLNVHHIKPFSVIVSEILKEHPEMMPSCTSDRLTLYDIITHDKRFLDEENLITLCKECHIKVHSKAGKTISSQASQEEGSETIPEGSTP